MISKWVQGLPGPVAVTYEAGPTGFDLYRALSLAGIRCEVAAPSKLQRPSGERVKTDAKDAIYLAGCCACTRSPRSRSRRWTRRPPGTWSGHVRTVVAI